MTQTSPTFPTTPATSVPPGRRFNPWAFVLLALTVGAAALLVSVSYGMSVEYGDTSASAARVAVTSFSDWALGIAVVVVLAGSTLQTARRSRGQRLLSASVLVVVGVALLGVPAGAVLGVHQKFVLYPALPSCSAGFTGGPAVPVVEAAQAGFSELDHPGPFSGGGSSGIDGCTTQLMLKEEGMDVPAFYKESLPDGGWRIRSEAPDLITATKGGQAFQATQDRDGSWWVWIGPEGLEPQPTLPGEVAPRR